MTANNVEQDLAERVRHLESLVADLSRHRSGDQPNVRDLRDADLSKVQDTDVPVYSSATGKWKPGSRAPTVSPVFTGNPPRSTGATSGWEFVDRSGSGDVWLIRGESVATRLTVNGAEVAFVSKTGTARVTGAAAGFEFIDVSGSGTAGKVHAESNAVRLSWGAAVVATFNNVGTARVSGASSAYEFVDQSGSGTVGKIHAASNAIQFSWGATVVGTASNVGLWTFPDLRVTAAPPAPVNVGTVNAVGSSLAMARSDHVHGPATALTPAYKVWRSTNQFISDNTETTVDFDTTLEDEGSGYSYSTATDKITVLTAGAGRCLVLGEVLWGGSEDVHCTIHLIHTPVATGVGVVISDPHASYIGVATRRTSVHGSASVRLAVGDTIHMTGTQDSPAGASLVVTSFANHSPIMSVTRIGP